jgi:probable F420-dependent oxidoreductase
MEFGLHLPHIGRSASRQQVLTFARAADEMGMHSGWVSDHVAWPREVSSKYPYTDDGHFPGGFNMPWLDPLGTLFFVAAATEKLKLGITVLILGYRPPLLTAKMAASLAVLSEGRLLLGVGVGWMKEEFDVLGMPYDHRGARADEQLDMFRRVFADETPSFEGRFISFPEVGFSPLPPGNTIPVWVGGDSEPAFRRTARYGDAFHAAFQDTATVAAAWQRVRELAAEEARDPSSLRCSLRWYLDPDASMKPAVSLQGSTQQMVDRLGELAAVGVDHVVLDPVARGGAAGRLDAVRRFMADVAPQVS